MQELPKSNKMATRKIEREGRIESDAMEIPSTDDAFFPCTTAGTLISGLSKFQSKLTHYSITDVPAADLEGEVL